MKPQHPSQTLFPLTPGQLLQGLHALFNKEVFRRFREEGPYLVALVRGGGEGLEALDRPEVWEAEAKAAQVQRDQLKEALTRLEREPALLHQEVARLRRGLALWRGGGSAGPGRGGLALAGQGMRCLEKLTVKKGVMG